MGRRSHSGGAGAAAGKVGKTQAFSPGNQGDGGFQKESGLRLSGTRTPGASWIQPLVLVAR